MNNLTTPPLFPKKHCSLKNVAFTGLFLIICGTISAQNIKNETIAYSYIKLPLQPLVLNEKNFVSSIFATFEEDNVIKKAAYGDELQKAENEYQSEMALYPARVKEAKDKYEKDLAEWNEKSLAEKVVEKQVLNENNKPVEQVPYPPQKRYVPEPKLQTSYDYPVVSETYLNLGGYYRNNQNAVNIVVTIHGYDYTEPRQMTEQKNVVSYVDGQSSTRAVTYYHVEFSYRHPMSVLVTDPQGNTIMNSTPQELNTYRIYKSEESDKTLSINTELLIKNYEEKIFQENLTFINNIVNDQIGYPFTNRIAELNFVKVKDDSYQDLMIAFNDASAGLKLLKDDPASAQNKLNNALNIWNTALQESDIQNKKARIDKDVTLAIYFNQLECYFAMRDVQSAENIISKLNGFSLSNAERKQKENFELLFNDLKKRLTANK